MLFVGSFNDKLRWIIVWEGQTLLGDELGSFVIDSILALGIELIDTIEPWQPPG